MESVREAIYASTANQLPTFMGISPSPDLRDLDVAVVGIPWDGGTPGRVGSRHGPQEIRKMSLRLRRMHPVIEASPFDLCVVGDLGDVPVRPFDQAATLKSIRSFYEQLHAHSVIPVTIGGDHFVTLPIFRAIAQRSPVGMIQFDAHCDTADTSAYGDRLAAATTFRRAVEEGLLDPQRVIQIGIRGPARTFEGLQWARSVGIRQITMDEFHERGVDGVMDEARAVLGSGPTYVSFDIDGIDPAVAPGTGVPVIGGYTTYEAQRMLRCLSGLNIVGGDVVEISPLYDVNNYTSLLGASLAFEIIYLVTESLCRNAKAMKSEPSMACS